VSENFHTFLLFLCKYSSPSIFLSAKISGWTHDPTNRPPIQLNKGVPLETVRSVWAGHWFWRRFAVSEAKQDIQLNNN
jgi:hypothetical protein